MTSSIVVWDLEDEPAEVNSKIIYWHRFSSNPDIVSIPGYLEKHAEQLREKYIAFIYELGERRIDGKSIIEHLDYDGVFSVWWMSHLAEKSPFKSPGIYDCLCLLALEQIILEMMPVEIVLVSKNTDLALTVEKLCSNLNIPFIFQKQQKKKENWSIRNTYNLLPYPLRGFISFRHLIQKWSLRGISRPKWFSDPESIFFCSYFYNLDKSACEEGVFYSRQWEKLPEYLQNHGKHNNWLHHFLITPTSPDVKTGIKWLDKFNQNADVQGTHAFLESYLSLKILFRTLKKWIWLNIVNWRLRMIENYFNPHDSSVWFWPFLKDDWKTCLTGPIAICNCLWIELFDAALKDVPPQVHGTYLWENQGWENAFLRAWRLHGHGKITGVPHATVRFWGLNNFDDLRSLTSKQILAKPLPDNLAVNGPAAWNEFVKSKYPVEKLEQVEAMRYQYLLDYKYDNQKMDIRTDAKMGMRSDKLCMNILLLGDFSFSHTIKMLECIKSASDMINIKLHITLKPHPSCEIDINDYPDLNLEKTDKPLSQIMQNFDVVFSSNTTSAGLDAFLAGLPVVVFLDGKDFNYSPLRGTEDIEFIGTPEELANAILNCKNLNQLEKIDNYFWLDNEFQRWKKLLQV